MASIWEKAISILAGNLNSGLSYFITTVTYIFFILGIDDDILKNDGEEMIDGHPYWAGKTLYELLKATPEKISEEKKTEIKEEEIFKETENIEKNSESQNTESQIWDSETPPRLQPDLTVQHCILEHNNPISHPSGTF